MPQVKEILKRVKRLEIKTHTLVDGLISGNYHSIFKGRGIEFSDVREYIPGDDIRAIDWNVTARYNKPYVKEFIEERDLNVYIAFDASASNNFGFEKSKKELGFEIAASIMFAALRNNDKIGLCIFTDNIEKFIRTGKGKKHFLRLLRELIYCSPKSKKTDINKSLIFMNRIIKKRSIIFIISDFLSDNAEKSLGISGTSLTSFGGFDKQLKFLKNRHDVILVNLFDINEQEIPDIGYIFLEDEETCEQMIVNSSDEIFRNAYIDIIKNRRNELSNRMKKLKVDIVNVKTDEPFHVPLRKFFRMRERRMIR